MNKAILMGRLGRDPEVKWTQAGGSVCSVSVATNEREKQGQEWVQVTEWHAVVVFGRTAELMVERLKKGDSVLVDGRMKTRRWTGKDGIEKMRTEVIADRVQFLGRLGAGERDSEVRTSSGHPVATRPEDDEVPF